MSQSQYTTKSAHSAHSQLATSPMRFAVYARFSSEAQNEVTLESQEMMCRRAIAERGGVVTHIYCDAAQFGWTLERDGFTRLREDAAKGRFDAVMMWKFDRLARDHTQATMIKALLRHEYHIKLFCVEGFSEDDDNSPYTAMMEQMLTIIAAFYSKNLSSEVRRATQYRHSSGKFIGSKPPFGYMMATEKLSKQSGCFKATSECPPGLYIELRAAAIVRRAFRMYATGQYSYFDIARYMTSKSHVLRIARRKNFAVEFVRDMLQNKTYAGYVAYAETRYNGGFRRNKAGRRGRVVWSPGAQMLIISEALFDECQRVRELHAVKRTKLQIPPNRLLSMKVYCAHCLLNEKSDDIAFGRMSINRNRNIDYWECRAERRGYNRCAQLKIRDEYVTKVVIEALETLTTRLPQDIQERVEAIVRQHANAAADLKHMKQLQEAVERIDFSWEQGFLDQETYAFKRRQLQYEIESARPVELDGLLQSAQLLREFGTLFRDRNAQERKELIDHIVERVIVKDQTVVGIILKGDIQLLLNDSNTNEWGSYRDGGTRTRTS